MFGMTVLFRSCTVQCACVTAIKISRNVLLKYWLIFCSVHTELCPVWQRMDFDLNFVLFTQHSPSLFLSLVNLRCLDESDVISLHLFSLVISFSGVYFPFLTWIRLSFNASGNEKCKDVIFFSIFFMLFIQYFCVCDTFCRLVLAKCRHHTDQIVSIKWNRSHCTRTIIIESAAIAMA